MGIFSVFCLALLAFLLLRTVRSRLKIAGKLPLILLLLLLMLLCAVLLYFSVYYRAAEDAKAQLPETKVRTGGLQARFFDGPGADTALIFYPGAKVEAAAYAPLLTKLAEGGVDCFLVEMPLRFAFFGVDAADSLMGSYAYDTWLLAGHSLGGVAASLYAAAHPDSAAGIVLLASYPAAKQTDLSCLSIRAENDGVLNREAYEKSRALLPAETEELLIPGGNHARFGNYGPQRGDGAAAISSEAQQRQTAEAILNWVHAHFAEGNEAA